MSVLSPTLCVHHVPGVVIQLAFAVEFTATM